MATFQSVAAALNGLVRSAVYPAMQRVVLQGEALVKKEAPVKRGTLRRSVHGRVENRGYSGRIGPNVPYAQAVHEGSRPHIIRPKTAKALAWPGARHPVKFVRHPGTKANRFIDRARAGLKPIAERELASVMNGELVKIR